MKMKCVEADKRKHFIGTIPFVGTVQFVCGIIHKDICLFSLKSHRGFPNIGYSDL